MKRRDFFKGSSALLGASLIAPSSLLAQSDEKQTIKAGTARNIIFMVSDGMSTGTLNMADLLLRRKEGRLRNHCSHHPCNASWLLCKQ